MTDVRTIVGSSGLLFQPHPDVEGFKTTRALSPEIVAFKGEEHGVARLSIKLKKYSYEVELIDEMRWITSFHENLDDACDKVEDVMRSFA